VYWPTLCYTCKWWHALKQQCRNFQSSSTTKKAWKCSRLFCQDQDQDQDFYLKTKTKTCVFVLEAPRDQDLGLEDYVTAFCRYRQIQFSDRTV